MERIKAGDMIFWFVIIIITAIVIWKMFSLSIDNSTLMIILILIVMSEILLWKAVFNMDKNTAVGFIHIRNDISNINNKLDTLIRRKK